MFFLAEHIPGTGYKLDLREGEQAHYEFDLGDFGKLQLLGDPVFGNDREHSMRLLSAPSEIDISTLFSEVRGHYYWFHSKGTTLTFGSSFGAIFPIYQRTTDGRSEASSSQYFLAGRGGAIERDSRYLLERQLFNYPLFDRTPWVDISLLPAHCTLQYTAAGMTQEKRFDVTTFFGDGALSGREDLEELCEVFSNESKLFLPDADFGISFTGGFDGRTLLASARSLGRNDFFTYSFGIPEEDDLTFPLGLAKELGIAHMPIELDRNYVEHHALGSAIAFMELSECNGNVGRPHYHYAARLLSERTKHIITGNFGSELFRALHQPGMMMSELLVDLFMDPNGPWKDKLIAATPPDLIDGADSLISEIDAWLATTQGLSANRRFYRFVIEEIFRKYFGPELVMQSHLLRNRTPFLSLPFFKALNATKWSGVHADLFEKQKNKRMKGQMFYAAFLKRNDQELYHALTNKGYSPADVLEPVRAPLLVGRLAVKRLSRPNNEDSNAVEAFMGRDKAALLEHFGTDRSAIPDLELDRPMENVITLYSAYAAWAAASRPFVHVDR